MQWPKMFLRSRNPTSTENWLRCLEPESKTDTDATPTLPSVCSTMYLSLPGIPCPETKCVAGEIQIRTPCLFSGYWSTEGLNTNSICADGFYRTGDYGFLLEGELYVIGRIKDIMIIAGQNIFPEDVEAMVNTVPGIYPGRAVSFGIVDGEYNTEVIAIVAEMKGDYASDGALTLEKEIRSLVLATVGIAPRYVAVVPERWIIKSTAGKISRKETRERFMRELSRSAMTQRK
jgi:acyl-CoA synthetase (AMP-forming)/AMP-acid ligase II